MLSYLLVTLAVAALLALRAGSRRAGHADNDWLPAELHGAMLMWAEKVFRCSAPVPMVARIDRAYRGHDGKFTLVEFKRRPVCRAYPSDVVELSVQRYVLQASGQAVNRRAYVAVVPTRGGRPRALAVQPEDVQAVERRVMRLLAVRDAEVRPNGPVHPAACRGCGHHGVCPHAAKRGRS